MTETIYNGVKIWCSIKSPERVVTEDLQTRVSENDLAITSAIDIVIGADHGQGQERYDLKIILYIYKARGKPLSKVFVYLWNCLLELTIYPYINKGLAILNNYNHVFVSKEEKNIIISILFQLITYAQQVI